MSILFFLRFKAQLISFGCLNSANVPVLIIIYFQLIAKFEHKLTNKPLPSAGTVLIAGQQQQLTATLTPNDIVNYTTASANVKINVLNPTQKINQMITFIQGITTSGELDGESFYELIAILNAAETNLNGIESDPSVGNPFAEPAELNTFIDHVKDQIDRGVLSPTNGQTLIDAANNIVNSLSNPVK
jgi:hypothetical protein